MNREEAKKFLPIIQAFAEGKKIEMYYHSDKEWKDVFNPLFNLCCEYRVKPEPKYRPFKDADECWNEMLKHQPFGWVKGAFGELERVQIVHNNITYQGGWSELNRFFAFVADDCWVRLILDIRKKPKDAEKQQELFVRLIDYARNTLGIKIAEAIVYWDWSYEVSPKLKITENHASVTNNVGIFKTPRMYAKKNNDLILSMNKEIADSENEVLLIDFVNLK